MTITSTILAGGISGVLARLVSTPFDVLKIRFQLQIEPIGKKNVHSKYTGVLQCLKTVIREEGLLALWKGSVPGMAMYIVFGSVQFTGYEQLRRTLKEQLNLSSSASVNFVCGCFGGALATTICLPLDVLRTRLVGQGSPKYYSTLTDAVRLMFQENGVRTFYKGLVPSLMQIVPQAGINFGMYSLYLQTWRRMSGSTNDSVILQGAKGIDSLICGGLAGVTSKTLTLPFDIVKKRLQVQGFECARQSFGQVTRCVGPLDAFKKILSHEGVTAFYKGAVPGILKTSITTSVSFYAYEYALRTLKDR